MKPAHAGRRLRIAFVTDLLHGPLGGILTAERFVEALRTRHDVTVVSCDATEPGDVRVPGVQAPVRAMRDTRFVMAIPTRAALERAVADADLVHLQLPFWLSFAALAEARRAGKPTVAAFHVQAENVLMNMGISSPRAARWVYRGWVEGLYDRTDAVVCPSPFAAALLREHGLRTRAEVISNGVPPDVAGAPARGTVPREPEHVGRFVVLAVGRLAAEKRQEVIIDAVKRSRHRERIALVIAGAGSRDRALRARARGLPVPVEVGYLPRERLARLWSTADLFVHASEVELEGIALLEAMAMGLPVVVAQGPASAASGFALDEHFAFPAGDAAALAARIDALIEQPARLAAAAERYREVAAAYPFGASLEQLSELYVDVVARAAFDRRTSATPSRPSLVAVG